MSTKRVLMAAGALALAGVLAACSGVQQPGGESDTPDYPTKAIEFIVPYDPGGSTDTTARVFAEALATELDGTVNVVNRPGGGTVIGITEAANANPDGYTVALAPASSFVTAPLTQDVSYSTDDFVSVVSLMEEAFVLVVHPDSGIKSVDDFDPAKRYTYVSYAPTHPSVLAIANLFDSLGVTGEGIPFSSASEAVQATAGGNVDVGLVQVSIALPQIKAGNVVPIAVTSRQPQAALPDVPTLDAAGYPNAGGFLAVVGFAVPAGVPQPILDILIEASNRAVASAAFQEYVKTSNGVVPEVTGPAWLQEWVPAEQVRVKQDVERLGLLGK